MQDAQTCHSILFDDTSNFRIVSFDPCCGTGTPMRHLASSIRRTGQGPHPPLPPPCNLVVLCYIISTGYLCKFIVCKPRLLHFLYESFTFLYGDILVYLLLRVRLPCKDITDSERIRKRQHLASARHSDKFDLKE